MSGTSIIAKIFVPSSEDADQTLFVKINVLFLGPSPSLYRCRLILFLKYFTDDPGNANFHSPILTHYIRLIKYYYI